jgi:hypothetical protein
VNPQAIVGLIRRHLIAVLVVMLTTVAVTYYLKKTEQPYQDTATIAFTSPASKAFPNPYASFGGSLIEAAGVISVIAMNPTSQRQVRAAGGTADYSVSLVNTYNLEYPAYSLPDLAVSTSSVNPADASRTFTVVTRMVEKTLWDRQQADHVPMQNRIGVQVLGESGPLPTKGSMKRVYGGVLVLAIVAALGIASFLDKHPVRLRRRRLVAAR